MPLLQLLGMAGGDEVAVEVVSMSTPPGGELVLGEASTVRVEVRLDLAREAPAPNPLGARLYFVGEDGARELVALARVDGDDHARLIFEAPRREGTFELWLASGGPTPLLGKSSQGAHFVLDGEWSAGENTLPSGDGEPGGDFVARFTTVTREPEPSVVAANLVSEVPDPEPSTEGESAESIDAPPEQVVAAESPPEPEPPQAQPEPSRRAARATTTPTPPQPEPQLTPPPLVENELPLPDRPHAQREATIADLLQSDAADLDAIIGADADALARALQDERARSGPLAGWEEELARTQGTFNGSGPKVRPGNQQAVATHRKEIFEYIALMHKRIHGAWADTYLINLDLHHRGLTNPLADPNLRTVLELAVSEDGKVADVQIVSSSGIQTYDAEAIRIAWESGPKEPVPETMLSPDGRAYLHWTFHRDQRQCGTFGVEVFILNEDGKRDSIGFDQDKVLAEEERLGLRREQRSAGGGSSGALGSGGGGSTSLPASPLGDHAGHDHGGAAALPASSTGSSRTAPGTSTSAATPSTSTPSRAAEPSAPSSGDTASADEPSPRPQTRTRQPRPQTRKRGAD